MSNKALCLILTICLIILGFQAGLASSSEEVLIPGQVKVIWTDESGAEWETPAEELSDGQFVVYLAGSAFPPIIVFQTVISEFSGNSEWQAVECTSAAVSESEYEFSWVAGENSPSVLHVFLQTDAANPAPVDDNTQPSVTDVPSSTVTVIVHYQTTDGAQIADDETYMGLRGSAVPVYAKILDEEWILTGESLIYVDIPADAPDTVETSFVYIRPTPTPPPPEVRVTVHYRDVGGVPVASDTEVICQGGSVQEIYASPEDLKENYIPTSESVQQVVTNTNGAPQEIIFFYTYQAPATPAPAYAAVRYVDTDGNEIAQTGRITGAPGQEMTVYNAPEQLQDYYVLDDEETKQVTMPASGETIEVIFRYRLEIPQTSAPTSTPEPEITPTPQPARVVGFVQVSYIYQDDHTLDYSEPVTVYEGITELSGADGLRTGYRLISADKVTVTLDSEGKAEPNQITFIYSAEGKEVTRPELIVQYFAEDGSQIATSTLVTLDFGKNTVYASPVDLLEGYEQLTPSLTVNVDDQGHADADFVTFYYRKTKTDEESGDSYQVIPASGYARAKNDSVNLRSSPSTANDSNIIGKISKTDIIEIKGTATIGGKWYYVSVNERQGYVSAGVVTELSDADVQVLLGLSDNENDFGDSGYIERWAQTTKKVWFRNTPNGKKIQELKKGVRVFVDEITDEEGTLWCKVRYNGKEGYIMSEFIDIYSAAESQNLQLSLHTAVPTHTVPATRVPTSTPTAFIPTATPTAAPLTPTPYMTATPIPYTGYAVTNTRAAVRGGLSNDNPALVTLNGETLVMIQGQTYVSGVCWDSVRVVSSGITGFIEDDKLFHVTNEVAQDYLEILATATPLPTPENTPLPFTGYAVILMDGAPMRQQMNSNAQYIAVLYQGDVVSVLRQSTADDGESWCLIQNGMYLGYVRRDMLRQMTDMEIVEYLEANHSRPTATPVVTATPRAQSAMASCWGIIKPDRANLRSEASLTAGTSLRLMSRNEFVQVQGSFLGDDGQVWDQVMYNGLVGYIRADYVQILTQGELTSVVTSEEFKSANTTETVVTGADSIQSYETYLVNQWTNPSLTASFEPFNPYVTPAAVASAVTEAPTPGITMPPTPQATIIMDPDRTPQPNSAGGVDFTAVFLGAGILAVGGAGFFAWQAFRGKKRRQALQRAQAIRHRQQTDTEPEGERRPRTYKRDAPDSLGISSFAKPAPSGTRGPGDEGEYMPPVTKTATTQEQDDGTRPFRRPEQSIQTGTETGSASVPETPHHDQVPAAGTVRRRRTERNHYDEDGF